MFDFSDEYCPHCDNHFVIEAREPEARLHVEGDDARMDNRYVEHIRSSNWQGADHIKYAQGRAHCARQGALPLQY